MKQPPWLLFTLSVMAALGIVQVMWLVGRSLYDIAYFRQENIKLLQEVQQKQSEVDELTMVSKYLNDPEFLEATARCKGYVRQGEQLYRNPQKMGNAVLEKQSCDSQYISKHQ